jgi:hypothetical protein
LVVAKSTLIDPLLTLEEAVAVAQHHDGVSGTSKQHVAFDYAKRISEARAETVHLLLVLCCVFPCSLLRVPR